jgi:hypothetical protein
MFEDLTLDQFEDLFGWGYESGFGEDRYHSGLLDYFNKIIQWRDRSHLPSPVISPGEVYYTPISIPVDTIFYGGIR